VEESRVVHERDCAPNEASGEADPPDDELGLGAEEDEGEAAADEGNKEGEGGEAGGEADVPGSGGGGEETKAEHGDLRKGGRGEFEFNKKMLQPVGAVGKEVRAGERTHKVHGPDADDRKGES
jgi:hypothetical protein